MPPRGSNPFASNPRTSGIGRRYFEAYCRDVLGLVKPFGRIPHERLNIDGGAISLGHPVGTSGARLVLHLIHALRRNGMRRGIASECIGGGQGGAMLIEAIGGART